MLDLDEIDTITTAAEYLARRHIVAVDLTRSCLDRIKRFDGRLHSFVSVTEEQALAAAQTADVELRAGQVRGPLHGIPFALKDVYDVAGQVTTAGSKAFINNVAQRTATAVARLQHAGAILIGKLMTHELTHGGVDDCLPWPPARNPWNTDRDTGGSSAGAGAAVAAGLCLFALGTDTGGSIRKPAGHCGIAGLKPTFGRVSRYGVMLNAPSLDHCGPMARTARDCAMVLQAIAGHDPLDPASSSQPVPDFCARLGGGIRGIRAGVVSHFWEHDVPARPEMRAGMSAALDALKQLGAEIRDVTLRPAAEYNEAKLTIQRPEIFSLYGDDVRRQPEAFGRKLRHRMNGYDRISAVDYLSLRAQQVRRDLTTHMQEVMTDLDVLVTAGFGPAPRQADALAPSNLDGPDVMLPFSMTGFPVISTCIGFTPEGLPLGMQIVGKPFDEATVLRVADAYERATPWRDRRPAT